MYRCCRYETALAVAPGCAEAHNNLGVLHRELGNMERAAACYTAALQARPNFPQAGRGRRRGGGLGAVGRGPGACSGGSVGGGGP